MKEKKNSKKENGSFFIDLGEFLIEAIFEFIFGFFD